MKSFLNGHLMLIAACAMSSCVTTNNVRIKNATKETIEVVDSSGVHRQLLAAGRSYDYPVTRTKTEGISTGVVEFSNQFTRFKDSIRINGIKWAFPENYLKKARWCSDANWLRQLFCEADAEMVVTEDPPPKFFYDGAEITLRSISPITTVSEQAAP